MKEKSKGNEPVVLCIVVDKEKVIGAYLDYYEYNPSVKPISFKDFNSKNQDLEFSNNMEVILECENETNNEMDDIALFIPKDWEVLRQGDVSAISEGDLNKDGIIDKAFVVTEKEQNNSSDYTAQRSLIIVFGNSDGSYDLSITAKNAILLADEGGPFGDPFDGIAIDRGSVLLKFMGGSSAR